MAGWIAPTIGYILVLGAGGVTAKLALRTITWQQLVLWVPIAYIVFSAGLLVFRGTPFPPVVRGGCVEATAGCAWAALSIVFDAGPNAPCTEVQPATSA